MNQQTDLKNELDLGNLIWMQLPSGGSAAALTKVALNNLGVTNGRMANLSAQQFVRQADKGFSLSFVKSKRVVLIGGLSNLSPQLKDDLLRNLSLHRDLKSWWGLNLVLVSPPYLDIADSIYQRLNPSIFQLFEDGDLIGINEKIHDYIEQAAANSRKPIWRLSSEAAEDLESTYFTKGEEYLKRLIHCAISHSKGKELGLRDLARARQFVSL